MYCYDIIQDLQSIQIIYLSLNATTFLPNSFCFHWIEHNWISIGFFTLSVTSLCQMNYFVFSILATKTSRFIISQSGKFWPSIWYTSLSSYWTWKLNVTIILLGTNYFPFVTRFQFILLVASSGFDPMCSGRYYDTFIYQLSDRNP